MVAFFRFSGNLYCQLEEYFVYLAYFGLEPLVKFLVGVFFGQVLIHFVLQLDFSFKVFHLFVDVVNLDLIHEFFLLDDLDLVCLGDLLHGPGLLCTFLLAE